MNSEERHAEALPRLEEVRPKAAGSHAQPEYDRVDTVSPLGDTQVAEEAPTLVTFDGRITIGRIAFRR